MAGQFRRLETDVQIAPDGSFFVNSKTNKIRIQQIQFHSESSEISQTKQLGLLLYYGHPDGETIPQFIICDAAKLQQKKGQTAHEALFEKFYQEVGEVEGQKVVASGFSYNPEKKESGEECLIGRSSTFNSAVLQFLDKSYYILRDIHAVDRKMNQAEFSNFLTNVYKTFTGNPPGTVLRWEPDDSAGSFIVDYGH